MNYSKIIELLPNSLVNLGVSVYNWKEYRKRYGRNYDQYRQLFLKNRYISRENLFEIQSRQFKKLVKYAYENSKFYQTIYKDLDFDFSDMANIKKLPIVSKESLRVNINEVYTIPEKGASLGKTGGTTGKSLVVRYSLENLQERFALLDDFRARFGYKLGKKTAWFSGKKILNSHDIRKNRYWKTDYLYNVRYYSTFHVHKNNLLYYVQDLLSYKPEYLVGFPSTMYDIAKAGLSMHIEIPKGVIKAIFPTSETITKESRTIIERFFSAKIYDQYASSEGAPFIFECKCGNKHLEMQSGVFEVLDENNNPAECGRLVVTSFTTYGTPLIRYDIGDSIELAPENDECNCGNHNPLVKAIHGRIDDYIYSPEVGKINLGNISNTTKGVKGLIQFQVVQNELNQIDLYVVIDKNEFKDKDKNIFIANWIDRVGEKMKLNLHIVETIPTEKSGKTRIVKNNIKHLINI